MVDDNRLRKTSKIEHFNRLLFIGEFFDYFFHSRLTQLAENCKRFYTIYEFVNTSLLTKEDDRQDCRLGIDCRIT